MPTLRQLQDAPALTELLQRILERIREDIPGVLGLAVAVQDTTVAAAQPVVLAQLGAEAHLIAAQTALGGPVPDALSHQLPVISLALWADDRWPRLTCAAVTELAPDHEHTWTEIGGVAAVPDAWGDVAVVLTCTLRGQAGARTVATLMNYEQLVSAALVTVSLNSQDSDTDMAGVLAVLQSRSAIEQAKGMVMGRLGCDADRAWVALRDASQRDNVKLRALAVALVEHVGGAPAEQQGSATPIAVDERARRTAKELWSRLTS
jgi:hypothetical protein